MVQTRQLCLEGQQFVAIPRKMKQNKSNTQPSELLLTVQSWVSFSFIFSNRIDYKRIEKALLNGELDKHLDLTIEEQAKVMLTALEIHSYEVEQRDKVINKLQSWLSVSFPSCRLLPFGSSVSGLSILNSDLDLYFTSLTGIINNLLFIRNFFITWRLNLFIILNWFVI